MIRSALTSLAQTLDVISQLRHPTCLGGGGIGFRAALALQRAGCLTLLAPGRQMGRVETFPTQQGTNIPWGHAGVGGAQNAQLLRLGKGSPLGDGQTSGSGRRASIEDGLAAFSVSAGALI